MGPTQESTVRRLGFHYFPDTLHYQLQDLERWVPALVQMDAAWVTLLAPTERAIPEYFIAELVRNGIPPILHFSMPVRGRTSHNTIQLLLRQYARWGVRWVCFFDSPNSRLSWNVSDWAQTDLVERFLDIYLPLAQAALDEGLTPILPPLEPGGDYWDLSFLQNMLQGLQRRGRNGLLDKLALGAYAWTGSKPLDWGIGGPDRWPDSRPYHYAEGSENQIGFRIFDWYTAISRQELGKELPILLLRAGSLPSDALVPETGKPDLNGHAQTNLAIARALELQEDNRSHAIPANVVCCCFWILSASEGDPCTDQAWFGRGDEPLPVVKAFYRWGARQALVDTNNIEVKASEPPVDVENSSQETVLQSDAMITIEDELLEDGDDSLAVAQEEVSPPVEPAGLSQQSLLGKFLQANDTSSNKQRAISHYVLLPLYAWGAAEWDIASIQPLLEDSHPTIGFSFEEARLAARVTVVGGDGAVSEEALEMLRSSGCKVERVLEDGTLVAP